MAKSNSLHCASFNFYSYSYSYIDHVRVPIKSSFLCFPQGQSERNAWGKLIKRRRNKDSINQQNQLKCVRSIFSLKKNYRPSGGTWKRMIQGARPTLNPWNSFTLIEEPRKKPLRWPPRKKVNVQQDLFELMTIFTLMIHWQIL